MSAPFDVAGFLAEPGRVPPDSGVATINPGFRPGETRWHHRPPPLTRRPPAREPHPTRDRPVAGTAERVAAWVRSGSAQRRP